jgi:hypothetical protein
VVLGKLAEGATVTPRATLLHLTVQFALESVSSLPWNHCPDSRGISVQFGLEYAHDTLASFRKRFGGEFEAAFVQVLQVARENQLSRFGTVSLDGTKIHANASRHSALSYGHAEKIEAQLKAEV